MKKLVLLLSVASVALNSQADSYSGLGHDSVSADTIAKFAPPKLETSLRRKIQSFLDLRAPGMGMVHPSGKKLFFSWGVTGSSQMWRLTSPQGFPMQMTGGEDFTMLQSITPDGKWLILSRDQNGEENPGVYLQSVEGGPLIAIFHRPKVRASFQWVTDDSKFIYFGANDIAPDTVTIYRYEIASQSVEKVFSEKGLWSITDYDAKKKVFLIEKTTGNRSSEYFLWNETDKESKIEPILGQNEKTEYAIHFSANAGEYLVLTDKFSNFRRLYRYKDRKFDPVTSEMSKEVSRFSIDHRRERILYEINDQGYTRFSVMNAKSFKPIESPKFPENLDKNADHVMFGSTTFDSRFTVFSVVTSQAPRMSFVYDWNKKAAVKWIIPSTPEIDPKTFATAKLESYPARDGTKIPMFVRKPKSCDESHLCSVVVHFHGGPEGQSTPGFGIYAQLFVDAGFIFVEPNVRGSDGYGKEWLDSDNGPKRLQVVTDIEDAAKYLRDHFKVGEQSPKVGVMGWSYGGYSTLYAMTRFAGAFDAGVAMVGMSNLVTFLKNTAPYRRGLRVTEYGDPDKDLEALKLLSPINYVSQLKAPLLISQGVNDPRVPVGEAVQFYEEAKKKSPDTQLVLFADEGHGSVKRENQVLELGNAVNFFQKHLRNN